MAVYLERKLLFVYVNFDWFLKDLMSRSRYGDMEEFCRKLKDMGYERVEMIDTTNGKFMSRGESRRLLLTGSTLLIGKK